MKLKKRQIKLIARIHSAIHLSAVDSFMFSDDSGISDEDQEAILQEINKIADKLAGNHSMQNASTDSIIKYVLNLK